MENEIRARGWILFIGERMCNLWREKFKLLDLRN